MEELVEDLRLDTFLEVDLEVVGQRCCWLGPQTVAHMTQVAREALSNVVQHTEATHVSVTLAYINHATQLSIKDNGRGVNLDELHNNGRMGEGLANIQARARLMDAKLDLSSQPGQGFQLILTIPCDDTRHPRQIEDRPAVEKHGLASREQSDESLGLETAAVDGQTQQGGGS